MRRATLERAERTVRRSVDGPLAPRRSYETPVAEGEEGATSRVARPSYVEQLAGGARRSYERGPRSSYGEPISGVRRSYGDPADLTTTAEARSSIKGHGQLERMSVCVWEGKCMCVRAHLGRRRQIPRASSGHARDSILLKCAHTCVK